MEVRARILNGSTVFFLQNGVHNINMDEIALNMGISKRTIYEYFKDKNEI